MKFLRWILWFLLSLLRIAVGFVVICAAAVGGYISMILCGLFILCLGIETVLRLFDVVLWGYPMLLKYFGIAFLIMVTCNILDDSAAYLFAEKIPEWLERLKQ